MARIDEVRRNRAYSLEKLTSFLREQLAERYDLSEHELTTGFDNLRSDFGHCEEVVDPSPHIFIGAMAVS